MVIFNVLGWTTSVLCLFAFVVRSLPITPEDKERSLLPNFVLGWTKTTPTEFRFTLRLDSPTRAWIGVGASRGLGVGSPIMTTDAAAVIARAGLLNVGFDALEYSITSRSQEGIVPWATTGPSATEITRCVQRTCPNDATRCQSIPTCVTALQCASQNFNGNGTQALMACSAGLGDGVSPESIDALGAFLDTAGCYFTHCASELQKNGIRPTNIALVSSSQVQDPLTQRFVSTLSFTAAKLGQVELNDPAVTLIAAYGQGSQLGDHGLGQHAALTLNLNTGISSKASSPGWVTGHAVLMTLGLGILIPVGVVMKIFRIQGHALMQVLAVFIGLVGVGWAAFYVEDIGSDPHHVLGIIVIVMFIIQPVTFFFRPSASAPSNFKRVVVQRDNTDQKALLPEDGSVDERQQNLRVWAMSHALFGYFAILLAVVNSFLGAQILAESEIDASQLMPLSIVFAAFAGITVFLSALQKFRMKYFPSKKQTENSGMQQGGILATSSNPNFDNATVKADDLLGADAVAGDGDDVIKVTPCYLVFQNVSYKAPLTRQEKKAGEVSGKMILQGCSGFCAPGSLSAIMGPSGSGKTSLLDILASRARHQPEAGSVIEVNGVPVHLSARTLARQSGYVLQEDVLHQYLTVFETLMNTARLILPATFTDQQRYDRVMRVIAQLGLGHACDTKIGGPEVRGLSGGERRRVSVAIQIIKSPSLLYLDEPTSGLDASTATKLVESLRDLANEGRTIVATIHQPSVQIFSLFDRLILLSTGRIVWSGSRSSAESFFAARNRPIPSKWNPADWFLLVVDTVRDGVGAAATAVVDEDDLQANNNKPGSRMSYKMPQLSTKANKRMNVSASVLRMSIATESKDVDVSLLTEVARNFYQQNNPDKLKNHPEIVDEVVKYGLRKGVSELDKKLVKTYGQGISATLSKAMMRAKDEPATKQELEDMIVQFEQHAAYKEIELRAKRAREEANANGPMADAQQGERSGPTLQVVSLGQQIRVLTERGATLAFRDPQVLKFQAIQNIIFGIVLGSLYSNLRGSQSQAYTLSMAMVIILGMVAMVTVALNTAVAFSDKQVFVREQNDSMYSPIAHFFARLVVGLPISFVVAACLIVPSYWWIGLKPGAPAFFFFFGVNLAMIFLFDGVVGCTAFLASDVTTAFGMGNFYEAISIFMSGIFIPFPLIPPYWAWLYYVTPFSYAYAAVAINEFEGTDNEFWLFAIGIAWLNQWGNLLVIILMGIMWRLFGLFLAIRVNKRAIRNMKPKAA